MNQKIVEVLGIYTLGAIVYFIYRAKDLDRFLHVDSDVQALVDVLGSVTYLIVYMLYSILCFAWPFFLAKDLLELFKPKKES